MRKLVKDFFNIINKSGSKLKTSLILISLFGAIFDSLSVSLVVPAVIFLSKRSNQYATQFFKLFIQITHCSSYLLFILSVLILIVAVYLCKTVFISFVYSKQNEFVFDLEGKISTKLLNVYLYQPYAFHLEKNSAELSKNIYYEVKQLCYTFGQILTFLSESLIVLLITLILIYFQPNLTLLAILFVGIGGVIFVRFVRKKMKIWAAARVNNDADRVRILGDALNNIKDIKLYGRDEKFRDDYNNKSNLSVHASMMYATFQRLPALWLEFSAIFILIFFLGAVILSGGQLFTIIPLLTLFAAAMFRILPSLNRISSAYQTIKFFTPIIHSVNNELNLPGIVENADFDKLSFLSKIELKNISYSYQNSQAILFKELSLVIKKGDYIGIIGQSGSGKSTLVDIVIGLLSPTKGIVEVDGVNIHNNLRQWQNHIGYVQQDINLIDDTIANNIAFGIKSSLIDSVLIKQAVIDAQLEEFINMLPLGLQTIVGEKGVRLSGGQKQRIAIARALYNNPLVLVFDEATSSLDTKTEAEIMNSIKLLKTNKTIIFVTHKKSLLNDCDYVYEMKMGVLIDRTKKLI